MFRAKKQRPTSLASANLADIDFTEKFEIEQIIDNLTTNAQNPYTASMPLIASAKLGDHARYNLTLKTMLNMLTSFDQNKDHYPEWMQSNSFQAWMWGRLGLAAKSMNDAEQIQSAEVNLTRLLSAPADNLAFATWAWGYRAGLNPSQYEQSLHPMIAHANELSKIYEASKTPDNLSNVLWASIMNLAAAACHEDIRHYTEIKSGIASLTQNSSIAEGLQSCLLTTPQSSDYPAWALAIVRLAAAKIRDFELYQEIGDASVIDSAICAATDNGQLAEYILSVTDNVLAEAKQGYLQERHHPRPPF